MMGMLNENYVEAENSKSEEWKKLDLFFKALDIKGSAFISINWDSVIERKLAECHEIQVFNYRCGAMAAEFASKGNIVLPRTSLDASKTVPVIKIHGSVNWLYCDNCRQLYVGGKDTVWKRHGLSAVVRIISETHRSCALANSH
jgi:hypothetical protein